MTLGLTTLHLTARLGTLRREGTVVGREKWHREVVMECGTEPFVSQYLTTDEKGESPKCGDL
jgi:hypothetical protein